MVAQSNTNSDNDQKSDLGYMRFTICLISGITAVVTFILLLSDIKDTQLGTCSQVDSSNGDCLPQGIISTMNCDDVIAKTPEALNWIWNTVVDKNSVTAGGALADAIDFCEKFKNTKCRNFISPDFNFLALTTGAPYVARCLYRITPILLVLIFAIAVGCFYLAFLKKKNESNDEMALSNELQQTSVVQVQDTQDDDGNTERRPRISTWPHVFRPASSNIESDTSTALIRESH